MLTLNVGRKKVRKKLSSNRLERKREGINIDVIERNERDFDRLEREREKELLID
jgi:hypothetical protein